ncbi:MAG: family 43 glycosylhydrolase, partial [Oscillospiraceae bacterium]|nr:family 43 glycosylhydrolase [Oscillospiraceae bacterium]
MENKETSLTQAASESSGDAIAKKFEGLKLSEPVKKEGENNPLITQDYGADPFAMEYNGRIYVYMTQDVYMYDGSGKLKENTYGAIDSLRCISSADMVNWTDHGQIHVGGLKGVTTWARNSWAPAAVWKKINGKDRFFLYFGNSGGGIGVLSSDSPTGPFTDPIGKALVTGKTPNCADVLWMFDPAVLIDDDGKAYMYFGGGVPQGKEEHPMTARVIELGEDMISTVGEAVTIDAPFMFEDSGINKIGNTYYYSYCSNFSSRDGAKGTNIPEAGEIIYMTSNSPK